MNERAHEIPTAADSARALLGAGLVHPSLFEPWIDDLEHHEFFNPRDALIVRAAKLARAKHEPLDPVTIKSRARELMADRAGDLFGFDTIDGYVDALMVEAIVFDPQHLASLASRVKDAADRRRRAQRLSELARAAFEDEDASEHLERVARLVEDERARRRPTADTHARALAKAEWLRALPEPFKSGLAPLDRAIGGLRAEGVYFLCGATGKGKTGLAIQISGFIARTAPVVYISSELSRRQVIARFVAQRLGCAWSDIYELSPDKAGDLADTVAQAFPRLHVVQLGRDDSVRVVADRIAQTAGIAPLVVLDYVQHAARRLRPDDMRAATSALSDEIARYTTDARATALALSSVARGFYRDTQDKTATDFLGAAKESGDLEFDASGVFFLDTELGDGTERLARLHVSKSRFGGEGTTIGLRFDGRVGRFAEDPKGALTDDQRDVFECIASGATTVEEVRKSLNLRNERVGELINVLVGRRLIRRRPLEVIS